MSNLNDDVYAWNSQSYIDDWSNSAAPMEDQHQASNLPFIIFGIFAAIIIICGALSAFGSQRSRQQGIQFQIGIQGMATSNPSHPIGINNGNHQSHGIGVGASIGTGNPHRVQGGGKRAHDVGDSAGVHVNGDGSEGRRDSGGDCDC